MGRVLFLWMMMLACALALTPAAQATSVATQETALTATQAAIPEVTVQQPKAIVAGTVIDFKLALVVPGTTLAIESPKISMQMTAMSSTATLKAKAKEVMAANYSVTPEVVAHAEIVYIKPIIAAINVTRSRTTAPLVLLC